MEGKNGVKNAIRHYEYILFVGSNASNLTDDKTDKTKDESKKKELEELGKVGCASLERKHIHTLHWYMTIKISIKKEKVIAFA